MNLKFWQKRRPVKIEILHRERYELRLQEWQADPQMVGRFRVFSGEPMFKYMLDVLENEHPAKVVQNENAALDSRIVLQARAEGYTLALANIRAMGKDSVKLADLVADFSPKNEDIE